MKKIFSRRSPKQLAPRRRAIDDSDEKNEPERLSSALYRRNRTITGSSSAQVASSNELNADLRSPRAHAHHLGKVRRKLARHFVGLVIGGILLYVLISQMIASVAVSPTITLANLTPERRQAYEAQISSYFDRHPLERTLFTLNTEALTSYVAARYPEVVSLRLDTTGMLGRVHAYVGLRTPIAKWSLKGENEFVDQQGVVFSYNAFATPALQIVDASGTATANGFVTSNRFLAFVGRVVGAAKSQNYTVTEASIPPLTTRQLEIKVDGVSYPIKYTIDRTAGEQAEDMSRAIAYLQKKGAAPQYLDVRVEGRAVYK
jgi:hypothetical protein